MANTGILRGRELESFLVIDLTGSTGRTLTAVEFTARTIRFSGTLGQSVTIRLPLSAENDKGATYTFENATSGGFIVTVAPPSGAGAAVAPSAVVSAYYDGSAMVASSGGALGGAPVVITSPVIGDAITWSGTEWVNQAGGSVSTAVILAPATTGRNVVQPTVATAIPLTLQGAASQSVDHLLVKTSANVQLARITSGGRVEIGSVSGTARLHVRDDTNAELAIFEGAGTFSSVFLKLGNGGLQAALRVYPQVDATSGAPLIGTGGVILRGRRWTGSASNDVDGWVRLDMTANSPLRYHLAFGVGAIENMWIRHDGQITLGATSPVNSGSITQPVVIVGGLFVNTAIEIGGSNNVTLGTADVGTQWGTASNQNQAWWGGTVGGQMVVTGDSLAARLASLEQQMGLRGLIAPPIPIANMLWDFNSDAITGTADNTALSTWVDSAPTPHNMVSPGTNGGTQIKFRDNATDNINGHPVVQVAAGNQAEIPFPNFSPVVNDASFTCYWVGRYAFDQAGHGILLYNFVTGGQDIINLYLSGDLVGANQVGWEYDVGGGAVDHDVAAGITGVQVLCWVFDKSGSGTGKVYRNDVQIGTTSSAVGGGGAGNGFDWGGDFIEMFAANGGTNALVGETARWTAYKVAHDDTTRQGIMASLRAYYGVA